MLRLLEGPSCDEDLLHFKVGEPYVWKPVPCTR